MRVQTMHALGAMLLSLLAICFGAVGLAVGADDGVLRNRLLSPGPGNPRNGEGDFIELNALHNTTEYKKPDWAGTIMCYLSDDNGKSWRRGKDQFITNTPEGRRVMTQEPGVVELKDGRLMMFIRGNGGSQYVCHSTDGGDTWSAPGPSNIISPVSPASIERIPKTGDLILVWNNHQGIDDARRGKRTPLTVAISRDEGKTWEKIKTLEDDRKGWYCYTAIAFVGDQVLLAHCSGQRRLAMTQITRFSLDWLYR